MADVLDPLSSNCWRRYYVHRPASIAYELATVSDQGGAGALAVKSFNEIFIAMEMGEQLRDVEHGIAVGKFTVSRCYSGNHPRYVAVWIQKYHLIRVVYVGTHEGAGKGYRRVKIPQNWLNISYDDALNGLGHRPYFFRRDAGLPQPHGAEEAQRKRYADGVAAAAVRAGDDIDDDADA